MSSNEHRDKIIEVAAKRFDYFGYKKTTVEEIASDAEISVGSVYLHFKNKEEILFEVLMYHTRRHSATWAEISRSGGPVIDRISEMVRSWVEKTIETKRAVFGKAFLEDELSADMKQRYMLAIVPLLGGVLIETIEEGKGSDPGDIRKELNSTTVARLIMQQMRTMVIMATQGPDYDWEEWWVIWMELVCGGICN